MNKLIKKTKRVSLKDALLCDLSYILIKIFIVLMVFIFILYPLLCIVKNSLFIDNKLTFSEYTGLIKYNSKLLFNSVFVSLMTAILSTILSVCISLRISFLSGWKRAILIGILLVTMISPPFMSSLAYIQLFGRRGIITYKLLGLSISPYGWWGIVSMQTLSFASLNSLMLIGVISNIDKTLICASHDLGASSSFTLRKVILGLMHSGIIVCFMLSLIRSLSDFGTPTVIGGRFNTLATEIYMQIIGYANLPLSSAMNMLLIVPAIIFFIVYKKLMKKNSTLSGGINKIIQNNYTFKLNGFSNIIITAISSVFFIMMTLQYISIFIGAFTKSIKGKLIPTLEHFNHLRMYNSDSIIRSIMYGIFVAIIGTLFGMILSYFVERKAIKLSGTIDFIATLPYMLPGTCFGIGYILAFNHVPLKLTGTAIIVILNMLFKQLPTTTKVTSACLSQIDIELEQSANDLGANRLKVIKDIVFPNLKSAFISGFVYNFNSCMTTIGSVIFIINPGQKLAVLTLFDAINSGEYGVASQISVFMIIITLVINILMFKIVSPKKGGKNVLAIK